MKPKKPSGIAKTAKTRPKTPSWVFPLQMRTVDMISTGSVRMDPQSGIRQNGISIFVERAKESASDSAFCLLQSASNFSSVVGASMRACFSINWKQKGQVILSSFSMVFPQLLQVFTWRMVDPWSDRPMKKQFELRQDWHEICTAGIVPITKKMEK